jgi:mannose-6-phosphate isomerase-like protein (cupin superfamily)
MATIEFSATQDNPFLRVGTIVPPELRDELADGELASEYRPHHAGATDRLQLFEVRAPADASFNAHSHTEDEIILVVEGELRAGNRVVRAGESMYVPGGTVYAFRAGPDGLRFFNFRPRLDATYLTARATRDAAARSR